MKIRWLLQPVVLTVSVEKDVLLPVQISPITASDVYSGTVNFFTSEFSSLIHALSVG